MCSCHTCFEKRLFCVFVGGRLRRLIRKWGVSKVEERQSDVPHTPLCLVGSSWDLVHSDGSSALLPWGHCRHSMAALRVSP